MAERSVLKVDPQSHRFVLAYKNLSKTCKFNSETETKIRECILEKTEPSSRFNLEDRRALHCQFGVGNTVARHSLFLAKDVILENVKKGISPEKSRNFIAETLQVDYDRMMQEVGEAQVRYDVAKEGEDKEKALDNLIVKREVLWAFLILAVKNNVLFR